MNKLLLKLSKYLSYEAISLAIPFLKPISLMAVAESPVHLEEVMGPEGTGLGPRGFGRC